MLLEEDAGLYGYISEGYWRDVGNLNEYQEAHLDALGGQVQIDFEGEKRGNCYVGEKSTVLTSPDNLEGTVLIGKNCMVGAHVKIIRSVIGDDCTIEDGAVIRDSIIWRRARLAGAPSFHRACLEENLKSVSPPVSTTTCSSAICVSLAKKAGSLRILSSGPKKL